MGKESRGRERWERSGGRVGEDEEREKRVED